MNVPRRLIALLILFPLGFARASVPDAIVAADGSGQFETVRAAIDAAPQITRAGKQWTILVKAGTYRELLKNRTVPGASRANGIGDDRRVRGVEGG